MDEASLSAHDRQLILERQSGQCFRCGEPLGKAVIFGHLVPRHAGGPHDHKNRVALHSECEAAITGRDRGAKASLPTEAEMKRQADLLIRYGDKERGDG